MDTNEFSAKLILLDEGVLRTVCLEEREQWLLGREDPHRGNWPDLVLTSRQVSRIHGWFMKTDGQWFYTENPDNLNGTYHNGRRLPKSPRGRRKSVMLESGDVLRIDGGGDGSGGAAMLFTMENSRHWKACALSGGMKLLTDGGDLPLVMGSLERMDGTYYVTAWESDVLLNGEQIHQTTALREGDRISVGIQSLCRNFYFLGNWLLSCE